MIVLHGDHTVQSRAALGTLLDEARQQHKTVIRLEAKKLTLADLQAALQADSLFGDEKLVVIEELHSLPTSNRKKELIETLAASAPGTGTTTVVVWEKRPLTATMLKKLGQADHQEFKLSKALFAWLDSLNGQKRNLSQQLKLLREASAQESEYLCFLMLARQIRMLLQATDGGEIKGPPFMVGKLKKQAQSFSLDQLLRLNEQLLDLDYRQKTSASALDLTQELDLLLVNL